MKSLYSILLSLFFLSSFAQINPKFYGEPEDYVDLKNRILLVEILEEDPEMIAELSKPNHEDDLKRYKTFVVDFNLDFKKCIEKYWTLHSKIEYKTTSEVLALNKAKNKDYAILRYTLLYDMAQIGTYGVKSGITIPALAFTRLENDLKKPDAKVYIPFRYFSKKKRFIDSDYKFAVTLLQQNITWIIDNTTTIHFYNFSEMQAKKNCISLKNKCLYVDNAMFSSETSKQDAYKFYGENLVFVSESELTQIIDSKQKDAAVLYAVPYDIFKLSGSVQVSKIAYFKAIVDAESNDILWIYLPSGTALDINKTNQIKAKDFLKIANCKF